MKIAILGEALIDFKSTGPLAFQGFIGGSSLNVATASARLGQPTAFLTQVSSDIFGNALLEHIEGEGIDAAHVLRSDASSTLAFVEEKNGQAHFSFIGNQAADTLYDPQPRPVLPTDLTFMQFGSISLLKDPTATSITEIIGRHRSSLNHNVTVVFDPNCRPALTPDLEGYKRKLRNWLRLAHLVKVSDQDLAWLEPNRSLDQVAADWIAQGPTVVIITRGEHGSTLYRAGRERLQVPTPKVQVVDTVGAGDTYTAGLMVGLLEHGHERAEQLAAHSDETLLEVMRFAAEAAAINCTRAGCNPPKRNEVI